MAKKIERTQVVRVKEEEKDKVIKAVIKDIEKKYGEGSIMKFGDNSLSPVEVIPTGCLSLDLALGIGGVPRGRMVEIYGPESSGKTTLALHIIAEAQKKGGMAAFIDAEHALDIEYAKNLGVNLDDLLISQPSSGEEALDITEMLVRSGSLDVIVIDSVAALTPKAEIDGDMGQQTVGLHARLMSGALRKLAGAINQSKVCIIFINQLREKVNTGFFSMGNPETTTGGRALKFYTSMRIDIRRISSVSRVEKGQTVVEGNKTRVRVVKNKLAAPFRTAEFDIMFGTGISKIGDLIDIASERDIIKKSGSWFSYNDNQIGQGRDKVITYLEDNQEVYDEIYQKVLDSIAEETNSGESK